jgi:uncharacterized membrane protein YcaP (DUF421 family)
METDFSAFDWRRLLLGEQPHLYYLEVLFKVVVVFCLLLLVMRLLGKRGQKNLSPMQQMLLIALGSSAGDVLLYPTVALGYATVILLGITALTVWMERMTDRSETVRDQVESCPRVLVRHGVVDDDALARERTNERELYAALRCAGARSIEQIELAILEVSGDISVFLNDRPTARNDLLDYLTDGPPDGGRPHPARSGGLSSVD